MSSWLAYCDIAKAVTVVSDILAIALSRRQINHICFSWLTTLRDVSSCRLGGQLVGWGQSVHCVACGTNGRYVGPRGDDGLCRSRGYNPNI